MVVGITGAAEAGVEARVGVGATGAAGAAGTVVTVAVASAPLLLLPPLPPWGGGVASAVGVAWVLLAAVVDA